MERLLTILLGFLVSFTHIGLVGSIAINSKLHSDGGTDHIPIGNRFSPAVQETPEEPCLCTSEICKKTAASLLADMDETADPCDDFYEFACGGFLKRNPIVNEYKITHTSLAANDFYKKMKTMMEEPMSDSDLNSIKLVKHFYHSCMKQTKITKFWLESLKDILPRMGGWPVVEGSKWNDNCFSWYSLVYTNRKFGYSDDVFFTFDVRKDTTNPSRRIIYISVAEVDETTRLDFTGSNRYFKNKEFDGMVEMAIEFGATQDEAKKQMNEAVNFEMSHLKNVFKRYQYNIRKMTVNDLNGLVPQVNWLEYINTLLKPTGIEINKEETVIVGNLKSVRATALLLNNTSVRVLANYVMWKMVSLPSRHFDLYKNLASTMTRRKQKKIDEQTKFCVNIAENRLHIPVAHMYVKKHFSEVSRRDILSIVQKTKQEFSQVIDEMEWMDQETKKIARKKLETMQIYIGYPTELLNVTRMEAMYKNLMLDSDNFLRNTLNIIVQRTNEKYRGLRDTSEAYRSLLDVSWITLKEHFYPFENILTNSIEIGAVYLHQIFYGLKRPNYINYGTVGNIIAAAILQVFANGLKMKKGPYVYRTFIWSSSQQYVELKNCFINQYNNIIVVDPHRSWNVTGNRKVERNLADNGAVNLGYRTYLQLGGAKEPRLPGLQYTDRQLFWIAAANKECITRSKWLIDDESDRPTEVPPRRYRVNVPFANNINFAKDFNCKPSTGMNPKKRCKLW